MTAEERIIALAQWGEAIANDTQLNGKITETYLHNKWFTEDNIRFALNALTGHYLKASKLQQWAASYALQDIDQPLNTIGIVMAGNIPLVGLHDLLCVLVAGQRAQAKLSSKDAILIPYLMESLYEVDSRFKDTVEFTERLTCFNAVIATGGNNTARYFDQYFGKYPHIIRKNRNSVAVLDGKESHADLLHLGDDIFQYFGLGCRNVSKLYVPQGYDFEALLSALEPFNTVMLHDKYKNNYDYQRTLLLLNNSPHYASDFLMLSENTHIASPIASLYFEYYDDLASVTAQLQAREKEIQCIVSKLPIDGAIPFGKAQTPEPWDYADNVDTLAFVLGI